MKEGTCRGCGARILFIEDDKGTRQVLDLQAPVFAVIAYGGDGDATCIRNRMAYVSHFATCPNASEFSKKRKVA